MGACSVPPVDCHTAALACVAISFVLLLPGPLVAQGQVPDPRVAMPERPTVATHARTVAAGFVELELGGQRVRSEPQETARTVPALVKIGLGNRVQFDLQGAVTAFGRTGHTDVGLGDLSSGIKWRVLDEAPVLGAFAVQTTIKLPTGSIDVGSGTGTVDWNLLLISSHQFGGASLDVNAGFTGRSGDGSIASTRAASWTAAWGLPVHGPLGWSVEIFGYPGTRGAAGMAPIVGLLTGPTWLIRKFLVIDGGAVVGLSGDQPTTVYVGLTWNMGRLWPRHESAREDLGRSLTSPSFPPRFWGFTHDPIARH